MLDEMRTFAPPAIVAILDARVRIAAGDAGRCAEDLAELAAGRRPIAPIAAELLRQATR